MTTAAHPSVAAAPRAGAGALVIASQMEAEFNQRLRAHPFAPKVLEVSTLNPWEAADDADVLLVRPSPAWRAAKIAAPPAAWPGRLRWVHSASAGVDFYPEWLLQAPVVTCGRGVAADEIADYVIAAIYLRTKDLESLRARQPEDWTHTPLGRISGSTIGIVGFGAIGAAVARRALALGALVTTTRRRRGTAPPVDGVIELSDAAAVAASADHLVLAVPATPETQLLINAQVLAAAKPAAHLINVARGSVLDQEALIAALDSSRLGFATLDVTEPEPLPSGHRLWTHPKVRLTPHVAANHTLLRGALFDQVARNLERFSRGEPLTDQVDPAAGY